ncbi:hypothetical protein TNIN_365271 [Trichonephila inaurata madagascariensis]|uniref:Uncharacterized protein n=1 Tax=Trichonephila inaurata madagascariensis TaxID=2747483 RepID=A0A8X6WTE3_9ARAC|nr:hypothetical protein TNIN_365271 [Trichonephila inaurata madagascariensis]
MDRPVRELIDSCTASNSSDALLTTSSGGHSGTSTPLSTGRLLSRNANGTNYGEMYEKYNVMNIEIVNIKLD